MKNKYTLRHLVALVLILSLLIQPRPTVKASPTNAPVVSATTLEATLQRREVRVAQVFEPVITSAIIALLIRWGIAEPFVVPSGSMEPTLTKGDRILVSKLAYRNSRPSRGDIVVFKLPSDPDTIYVKRVIAFGGETVEIRNGKVYIDGSYLEEPYVKEQAKADFGPIKVPSNGIFVLGDNRNNSVDSRSWGAVPLDNIIGKALVRFWPLSRARKLTDQILLAPRGLSAQLVATASDPQGYVEITWSADENAKSYIIQRSTKRGRAAEGEVLNDSVSEFIFITKDIISYRDYAIEPGHTYYYVVRAVYPDGSLTPPSKEVSVTVSGQELGIEVVKKPLQPESPNRQIDSPMLQVYPTSIVPGQRITIEGLGFPPNTQVGLAMRSVSKDGQYISTTGLGVAATTDSNGHFVASAIASYPPESRETAEHRVVAIVALGSRHLRRLKGQ